MKSQDYATLLDICVHDVPHSWCGNDTLLSVFIWYNIGLPCTAMVWGLWGLMIELCILYMVM